MCTKLTDAWSEIDEHGNWDDLAEHSPEDLRNKFDVSEEDSDILWMVIQSRTDNRRSTYDLDRHEKGIKYLGNIQEALHQSLDGWTEEQGLIIQAFLSDVAWATYQEEQYTKENKS